MATQNEFLNEPPRKQGMSSTAKVLIILGSIAGVSLLVCCGGVAFFYWKFQDAISHFAENFTTTNPQEIRDRTANIVRIDIPEEFPPIQAFDWFVIKQVVYGNQQKNSILMIMEMSPQMLGGADAGNAKQQRDAMLQQLKQQQGQQPGMNTDFKEESSETREFTIDGEKVPFEFIKGTGQGGAPTRQVVGVFKGREGLVMLMLIVRESDFDEAAVVRMIESIRLPEKEPDSEMIDESDSPAGTGRVGNEPSAGQAESAPADGDKNPDKKDADDDDKPPPSSP